MPLKSCNMYHEPCHTVLPHHWNPSICWFCFTSYLFSSCLVSSLLTSPPLVTSDQRSLSLSKLWLVCSYLEFLALLTQTKSSVAQSLRQLQVGCSHDTRSSWERQIVCLVQPPFCKLCQMFAHRFTPVVIKQREGLRLFPPWLSARPDMEVKRLDLEAEGQGLSFTLLLTRQGKDRLQECSETLMCSSENDGYNPCVLRSLCAILHNCALWSATDMKCL